MYFGLVKKLTPWIVRILLLPQFVIYLLDVTLLRLVSYVIGRVKQWFLIKGIRVAASTVLGDDDAFVGVADIYTLPPDNPACERVTLNEQTESAMVEFACEHSSAQIASLHGSVQLDFESNRIEVSMPAFRDIVENPFLVHCQYYQQPVIISTVASLIARSSSE